MKRFNLITETDARRLDVGSTVELASDGHITPLAADTLRVRRVAVIPEGADAAWSGDLLLATTIRRVAIGGDHAGRDLVRHLARHLRSLGLQVDVMDVQVMDVVPGAGRSVDYPDVAAAVGRAVAGGEADAGVIVDGSGVGSAIAANKIPGIRAAMCPDVTVARYAREHSGANVATLGATLVTPDEAVTIVDAWLASTIREPRYIKRLVKIARLERRR